MTDNVERLEKRMEELSEAYKGVKTIQIQDLKKLNVLTCLLNLKYTLTMQR